MKPRATTVLVPLSGARRPALRGCSRMPAGPGRTTMGTLSASGGSFYRPAAASLGRGQADRSASSCAVRGVRCRRWGLVCCRRGGSSHLRLGQRFRVPLAVASWGVSRLGERRSRVCRWSRGRRSSGCGSEATDRRAALPQSHPSGVAGRLTRTRLRRVADFEGHAHSSLFVPLKDSARHRSCPNDQCPIPPHADSGSGAVVQTSEGLDLL